MDTIFLSVFDRGVRIHCEGAEVKHLLITNYGAMQTTTQETNLSYTVGKRQSASSFFLRTQNGRFKDGITDGEFLYRFESDLTVEMQRLRSDLCFLHAAALEIAGRGLLLIGKSKSGKSTTTWALTHYGFRYLSDELASIDPESLQVYPYPRALWLRRALQDAHPLPTQRLQTTWMLCVPTEAFPNGVRQLATPLRALYFLQYNPEVARPSVVRMGKAEAAARILANALNPAAHLENGLDLAATIAKKIPCFDLTTAGLRETCNLLKNSLMQTS